MVYQFARLFWPFDHPIESSRQILVRIRALDVVFRVSWPSCVGAVATFAPAGQVAIANL